MTPAEILNLFINAGGTGILIWLVFDMRKEQRTVQVKIWQLLNRMVTDSFKQATAANEPRQQPDAQAEMSKHGFNSQNPAPDP